MGGTRIPVLGVALASLAVDFVVRQKIGGTSMSQFIVQQLPVPPPDLFDGSCPWDLGVSHVEWLSSRTLELVYTASDMSPFATEHGDVGRPFRWNTERRAQLRAELDACFFHVYGLDRADTEYVLGSFPIANRKDPDLTKRVLAAYDALAEATTFGRAFVSPLDPPPGLGPRHADSGTPLP
jgi:hypothetical protein